MSSPTARGRSQARRPTAASPPPATAPAPGANASSRAQTVPQGIVFLDFDNTLIDGDAGPAFGWYLFARRRNEFAGQTFRRLWLWIKYLPYIFGMALQWVLYKVGAVRRSTIVRASYKGLRRAPSQEFYSLMAGFAQASVVPRIYPLVAAEVRGHLAAGRECVVVTTGMERLVRHVLDHIDPRIGLIGCRLRERGGRLTGKVDGPLYGLDKANILHAYARARGVELEACWAYSDHWSDKQMLEAVGHPVAVNPRGRLRREARRRGWRVLEPPPVPLPAPPSQPLPETLEA